MSHHLLIRDKDRIALEQLLACYLPSVTVWAYGSRVNGRAHDASDLNLVLRSTDLSPIPFSELGGFISAVRESTIPILIEARDWARLPVSFHEEIEKKYVVVREGRR